MMKVKLAALALAILVHAPGPPAGAQETQKRQEPTPPAPAREVKAGERLEADDAGRVPADVPAAAQAHRTEGVNEEAEGLVPSYNNFLSTYVLGPEDVISISVFGLDRYSKPNIIVPPDGRIDYFFIKGGLHVVGKTRQQVEEEITRHLDEYIREPMVTVTLEKAMSQRFSVVGDVAKPGVFIMNRRLSVYEAVMMDAGGVLRTGKKQVVVMRLNADRMMESQVIDLAAIEKRKSPDNYFLRPGDQVFVPGNRWKTVDAILKALPVISFARIFTGGF
jgi:polysaccharide export outer membrane protein